MLAIETRRDLARHLQAQMAASRRGWAAADAEEEDAARTQVKTYLVESHCDGDPNATLEALASLGGKVGFRVEGTKDVGLFRVATDTVDFWCDASMPRFWRLYTTARVDSADKAHETIVSSATWLDKVWLPPSYLETLADKIDAEMLTFSLRHDRRQLHRSDRPTESLDSVTMRLWASNARQTLRKLRDAEVFPHAISVRSVRLRSGSAEPDGDYCTAEYFSNGKITASGTSFDEYNRVVVRVLRDYDELVRGIERRYAIGATRDASGQPLVGGQPIVIDVNWTIDDLEYAVEKIFSSGEPFRLWGLPERVAHGHFRARAVDLHVGGVVTFDITTKQVVILLPIGACGNTVVRFLNNLRFHVNADVGDAA